MASHIGQTGPCEDCGERTFARWNGGRNGPRSFYHRCAPCSIASQSCTRTHGIESELRAKVQNYRDLAGRADMVRALQTRVHLREITPQEFQEKTGFSIRDATKRLRLLKETTRADLEAYNGFQLDPLGLQRISDDRDFIQRLLEESV